MPVVPTWPALLFLSLCKALSGQQAGPGHFLPPCDSQIYCTGQLLQQVQEAQLFEDDKHFVDMPLKASPDAVLEQFWMQVNATPGGALPKEQLAAFVDTHFSPPGEELENWVPPDWTASPPLLGRILDEKLRSWAQKLNEKWRQLGRQMKPEVKTSPERHSLIYVPNPLIVPGGRFREYYYWDSFWVLEGLLLSNMTATAEGMIRNFLYLMDKLGHVPNGGRVYYKQRSQPPFLTLMVESYLRHTNSTAFLRESIGRLEAEYRFWQENRSVNVSVGGKEYVLNRYHVQVGEPRPESYWKDALLAVGLPRGAQRALWAELHSAAESGWDFSSRWFLPGPPPLKATLQDTQPSAVLPVDLNAILCRAEQLLASFYETLGDHVKAKQFQAAHQERALAVRHLFWDEDTGAWFDYNLLRQRPNKAFYPSNLMPLWAECGVTPGDAGKVVSYLKGSSALSYTKGLPTSLAHTGQQWDLPNAWAPLQQMTIEGLAKSSSPEAQQLAFTLAQQWVRTNLAVYERFQSMFEKYDVEGDGQPGGGGEYEVQEGFGWTNGVILQLLDRYGEQLTSAAASTSPALAWLGVASILLLALN
ncbi:hypothetical protein JRQ81_011293 [Phrynocephalus forsythii]|uniref:Trehalase n=1 Tax=Phrynocephalus forsythii TaxID=171643 RepID=A0A9Q1AR64_9SAUR|nr:hypothetical protein JRQ81_011293 [Phrynocephalus forsythii]